VPTLPQRFAPGDELTAAKLNRLQARRFLAIRGRGLTAHSGADQLALYNANFPRTGPRCMPALITAVYGATNPTYDAESIFGNVTVLDATPFNRIFATALVVHLPAAVGTKCILWSDGTTGAPGATYSLIVFEQVSVAQCDAEEAVIDGGEFE
jgi:hypothetical protein